MAPASWRSPGRRSAQMRLIPASALGRLYAKSDARGAARTGFHVAPLATTGALIDAAGGRWWLLRVPHAPGQRAPRVGRWFRILLNPTYYRQFHFAITGTRRIRAAIRSCSRRRRPGRAPRTGGAPPQSLLAVTHLFPSIPFHQLPAAHRWLRAHLHAMATGYVAVQRELYAELDR